LLATISIFTVYVLADKAYMDWFKVNDTDDPTSIFSKTTDIAESHWVLVPTGILMIVISVLKLKPASRKDLVKWHHWFMGVYFIFTTVAFSGLITLLLKNMIGRVRPNYYDGVNLWQLSPFQGDYAFLSFPSGHATSAGAVAMIAYLFIPKYSVLFFVFALWIAVSRLAVGAHYPSDLAGGLAVGIIFTWVYARSFAMKRFLFEFDEKGRLKFRKTYCSR